MRSIEEQRVRDLKASGAFDEEWYCREYPDVRLSGLDPAVHYLEIGVLLGRRPGPSTGGSVFVQENGVAAAKVDVIVPVFNALEDVQRCLLSLRDKKDGFDVRVIVVNDGSGQETTDWLRSFVKANQEVFVLLENENNLGYTRTVNRGLAYSSAPFVVTLNSDAIVTEGWLSALLRGIQSDSSIGIAGPLSNAASWQSVPDVVGLDGGFAVNELPAGCTADDVASAIAGRAKRVYPTVPFVNGFCFMIRREVIESIGLLDEESFPMGYGEENDYCIRAQEAGFRLVIVDDAYVYHAKSKSFGHAKRKELSKQGSNALKAKHGSDRVNSLVELVKSSSALAEARAIAARAIETLSRKPPARNPLEMKVLFLLPVSGGGGGVHSIVQEVLGMQRIGVEAKVAVPEKHLGKFHGRYRAELDPEKIFIGFQPRNLAKIASAFDVVVGTIYTSVKMVKEIVEQVPGVVAAYYIQDYEPFFSEEGTPEWQEAFDSYTLIPDAILFAKTNWLQRIVEDRHGVRVHKVSPSIDHDVYYPGKKVADGKIRISAMIRPKTPRRGAERTMRVLKALAERHGDAIEIDIFGCESNEPGFLALDRNFAFRNHGVLSRSEVAEVLRGSDIFLDLSDYQAFGRTGLEAMACGVCPILPSKGGVSEYAVHEVNSLIVDVFQEFSVVDSVSELVQTPLRLNEIQIKALETASRYSIHRAAVSELLVLAQ